MEVLDTYTHTYKWTFFLYLEILSDLINIEMALKSRSYILDLDLVKLVPGNFLFELFDREYFSPNFLPQI